ncbi:T-lymphocyte activation antigen CD80 [Xenopus tropicalis]|uniref:CD80 molecule n=1 Tax=Xenopus tropicalis TaxID=8364 RepID=A0A803JX37_XENTR|nr:T-lymphocyte activation antigen CD80 [Xenopus tropicalis]|eukprot:XP_004919716.1 PREDICTED: T-lymphocyte activation antigen CD80 [Xenopus tropicalis]
MDLSRGPALLHGLFVLCAVLSAGVARQVPISAQVGASAILPCDVPTPSDSQWETLRLFVQRQNHGDRETVVFSFSENAEQTGHQTPRYRNRTHLFRHNASLSLSHIHPWDEGQYVCHVFLRDKGEYQPPLTTKLSLSVWADFSKPMIEERDGEAECVSVGGFPEGRLSWTLAPPARTEWANTSGERHPQTRLYNVSARIPLDTSVGGRVTCCVHYAGGQLCSDPWDVPPNGERSPHNQAPSWGGAHWTWYLSLTLGLAASHSLS